MKVMGITTAALAILLTGFATPSQATEGRQGGLRDHYAQQQNRHQRPQRSSRSQRMQEQQRMRHGAWQEHRASSWESDHRSWQDRGGYQGYRVPDPRFRRYFGPQHQFRINSRPFRVYGGSPSFQYRGYWLTLADPWPESWANDWYDTDDVYVTNIDDGYYLRNRRYPQARIALRISM